MARGCGGRTRHHGDAGACRRRGDHGHPAHPAQKHRTPVRSRRGTPSARAGVDADVEAGLPRSDLHRPRAGHPRHQPPDRRAVADPDRRHVPGAVVLCAAGTHLPLARGHLPGGPRRAGDLESTGGAGTVEAVAFLARSCHPMDGPASGADGRRSHARSVGGGVRHPGVGVRGDLSDRENDRRRGGLGLRYAPHPGRSDEPATAPRSRDRRRQPLPPRARASRKRPQDDHGDRPVHLSRRVHDGAADPGGSGPRSARRRPARGPSAQGARHRFRGRTR